MLSSGDVAFATVTFNRPDALRDLLGSIRKQYGHRYEIHVANHGKNLVGSDSVASFCVIEKAKLHQLDFNVGLSAARNHLAKTLKTEFMVLVDDDMLFDERFLLDEMLDLARKENLDVVVPRLEGDHSSKDWFGFLYPRYRSPNMRPYMRVRRDTKKLEWKKDTKWFITEAIPPGAMLVRRQALLDVPFDERLKQCEEIEWSWRAKGKLRIAVYVNSWLIHKGPERVEDPEYEKFRGEQRKHFIVLSTEIMDVKKWD